MRQGTEEQQLNGTDITYGGENVLELGRSGVCMAV